MAAAEKSGTTLVPLPANPIDELWRDQPSPGGAPIIPVDMPLPA